MPTFRKLPSGRWNAQVYLGPGKFKTKTFDTRVQANGWASDLETARAKGGLRDERLDAITVDQLWVPILKNRRATLAPATVRRNENHWRLYLKPRWGEVAVASIRRTEVQAWVSELVESGKGVPTIEATLRLLGVILDGGVDEGIVNENAARRIKIPKHQPSRRRFITSEELSKVIEHVEDPGDQLLLAVMGATGLSVGEALGLTRADVARDCSTISVHRVWTRSGWKDTPKTSSRRRTVPVPVQLRAPLLAHVADKLPGASVFPARDDRNLANRVLTPACKAAKVDPFGLHSLRHHAASTWIKGGLPLFEVARGLGHSSTRMVEAHYGHLSPDHTDRLLSVMSAPILP